MATENSPLTPEQLQQVNGLIDTTRQEFISSLTAAVQAKQSEVMETAKRRSTRRLLKSASGFGHRAGECRSEETEQESANLGIDQTTSAV